MKQKIEQNEAKNNGNHPRSNGKYDPHSEKTVKNGHNNEKGHHNYVDHGQHSHSPYQMKTVNSSIKLKTESNVCHMNQQQYIQIMELEFQAIVRGYEIKLKNLNEQYRRSKQEMENKLKQLFQEKNHWQNLATRYSENSNSGKSQQIDQIVKQKQKINKLQIEKDMMVQKKQDLNKQLRVISQQNAQLKLKIAELSKNQNKNNKYTSQPRINRSLPPSPVKNNQCNKNIHHSTINSSQQPSSKEFQFSKIACEKMKAMIFELNQQIIKLKLQNLNLKYEKDNGMVQYYIPTSRITNSSLKESSGTYLSFNNANSRLKNK